MSATAIARIEAGSSEGKYLAICTGFPVGRDLLLTARHVVLTAAGELLPEIQIAWIEVSDGHRYKKKHIRNEVELVEDFGKQADIVLLKCDIPEEYRAFFTVASILPNDNPRWESFGYAGLNAKLEHELAQTEAAGRFNPANQRKDTLSLTYETGPDDLRLWDGMSGAPVYIGKIVYAVITGSPPISLRGKTFTAAALPYLIEHQQLGELLGYADQEWHFCAAREMLELDPDLGDLLQHEASNKGLVADNSKALIEVLANQPVAVLIDVVQACQKSSANQALVSPKLSRFLCTMLPVKTNIKDSGKIRRQKKQGMIQAVFLNNANFISAEMLMAHADMRTANFKIIAVNPDDPEVRQAYPDKYLIPAAPEHGVGDVDSAAYDIGADIDARLAVYNNSDNFTGHLADYIYGKAGKFGPPARNKKATIGRANRYLKRLTDQGKAGYYYFLFADKQRQTDEHFKMWLKQLDETFPLITFVVLMDDEAIYLQEYEIFDDLHTMLEH